VRDAAVSTLVASGIEVVDLDIVTTPGVAMMVKHLAADAGVIATASHNPIQWNGLKFLNAQSVALPPESAEQIKALEAARAEAQRVIAEGRTTGEKLRSDMLEQTKHQQQELLERARVEINNERLRAIADLRREAVDLALAGASRVIERNLDDQTNRKLVESFLSTVPTSARGHG